MMNYSSKTWKAQEKRKNGEDEQVQVPVLSEIHCEMVRHDEKPGLHKCYQHPIFTNTGLHIPSYGWSQEGQETLDIFLQEILETDRINHGTEFDKAFKEAMRKEWENEQINRKRKQTGIEVYNDLNRNGWDEGESPQRKHGLQ